MTASVGLDNFLDAHEGTGKHGNEREDHEKNVLPQFPLHWAKGAVGGEEDTFDEGWDEETQTAEENGTDQADEWLKIGHCDGESAHDDHNERPDSNLR